MCHDIRETSAHPRGWIEASGRLVLLQRDYDAEEEDGPEYKEWAAVNVVCHCCDGKGTCVNPSIDSHGISSEEFDEDPDFREDYFDGRFDISCPHCKGRNVVLEPATDAGKAAYQEAYDNDRSYAAEVWAERRMGA